MHQYQTRLASKISYYLPKARANYGKFNIRFFGAKVWNSIEESLLKSKSRTCFKILLKNHLSSTTDLLIDVLYFPVFTRAYPLLYLRIGSFLACIYRVMDARGKFGEHERRVRVARGAAESNSSFLSALQTSQVHP